MRITFGMVFFLVFTLSTGVRTEDFAGHAVTITIRRANGFCVRRGYGQGRGEADHTLSWNSDGLSKKITACLQPAEEGDGGRFRLEAGNKKGVIKIVQETLNRQSFQLLKPVPAKGDQVIHVVLPPGESWEWGRQAILYTMLDNR